MKITIPTADAVTPERAHLLEQVQQLLDRAEGLQQQGEPEAAMEQQERALGLMAGERHPRVADVLHRLGVTRARIGQTDTAEELFQQSLEVAAWCGYVKGQAYAVNCMAVIAQRRGDMDLAESQYRRAGRLAGEVGEARLTGMVEQNLGTLANTRGDLDSAIVHYEKSLKAFEEADDSKGACWVLNNMGMLPTDLRRFDEAHSTLLRGRKLARGLKDLGMEGLIELNRAEALLGSGRLRKARKVLRRAIDIAEHRGDTLLRAEALKGLAVIDRERGQLSRAASQLEEAHDLAGTSDDALLKAEILREMGEVRLRGGEPSLAQGLWRIALTLFEEMDAVLDGADLRTRLQLLEAQI